MPSFEERVLQLVESSPGLDDDELAAQLDVARQQVNQTCRRLESKGLIVRSAGWRGKIVSKRTDAPMPSKSATEVAPLPNGFITEDDVKAAVKGYLEGRGYSVTVAWGRQHGLDIDARTEEHRLQIEAKGEVASQPQKTNYFLGALGELIQRMSDPYADYALALPDQATYRGLVGRLPTLARERLRLRVFFVARAGESFTVREDPVVPDN
jgi:biotin operon repressor